jgi:hypothetical protein
MFTLVMDIAVSLLWQQGDNVTHMRGHAAKGALELANPQR